MLRHDDAAAPLDQFANGHMQFYAQDTKAAEPVVEMHSDLNKLEWMDGPRPSQCPLETNPMVLVLC